MLCLGSSTTLRDHAQKCQNCGVSCHGNYCSQNCFHQKRWNDVKKEIQRSGRVTGNRQARRYLTESAGHRCAICGIESWAGKDILLVVDHVDGNSDNQILSNLRLVCSNCDSQLPTYKGKNHGHGRQYRRTRYAEGKSY
jgi:hypothetical protein